MGVVGGDPAPAIISKPQLLHFPPITNSTHLPEWGAASTKALLLTPLTHFFYNLTTVITTTLSSVFSLHIYQSPTFRMPQQSLLQFAVPRKALAEASPNIQRKRPYDSSSDANLLQPPAKASTSAAPASQFTQAHTSRSMVLLHLNGWVQALGAGHRYIGTLGGDGTQLRMPLKAGDGRQLTWSKFADEV